MISRETRIAAAIVLAVGGAASLAWGAGSLTVDQSKLQFSVADLAAPKGATVTFRNLDRTSHNIQVGGPMTFDGGLQPPGDSVDVLFAKAGEYTVTCGIHPKMLMHVHVK